MLRFTRHTTAHAMSVPLTQTTPKLSASIIKRHRSHVTLPQSRTGRNRSSDPDAAGMDLTNRHQPERRDA